MAERKIINPEPAKVLGADFPEKYKITVYGFSLPPNYKICVIRDPPFAIPDDIECNNAIPLPPGKYVMAIGYQTWVITTAWRDNDGEIKLMDGGKIIVRGGAITTRITDIARALKDEYEEKETRFYRWVFNSLADSIDKKLEEGLKESIREELWGMYYLFIALANARGTDYNPERILIKIDDYGYPVIDAAFMGRVIDDMARPAPSKGNRDLINIAISASWYLDIPLKIARAVTALRRE